MTTANLFEIIASQFKLDTAKVSKWQVRFSKNFLTKGSELGIVIIREQKNQYYVRRASLIDFITSIPSILDFNDETEVQKAREKICAKLLSEDGDVNICDNGNCLNSGKCAAQTFPTNKGNVLIVCYCEHRDKKS